MFEAIFMILLGLIFLFIGLNIWKKEKINLIRRYHHKKVLKENKKNYTEQIGKSIILVGVGIILSGIIDFITNKSYGWLLFTIFFILGFIKILKAQKKYNSGIF